MSMSRHCSGRIALLSMLACLSGWAPVCAQEATLSTSAAASFTLADCLRVAYEQQPTLHAQRASLAAAHSQYRALSRMSLAGLLHRDLPIRKQQACLGVRVAEAGLSQSEFDIGYAVNRTYYGVLYARQQARVAEDVVTNLRFYQERVKALVAKGEGREYTTSTVDKITVYLRLAETRQAAAARGIERATAALREAMGVAHDLPLDIREEALPSPQIDVDRQQIVDLALSRRGELTQAATASDIAYLEIGAQSRICLPTARTFASATDIHARPVPQGQSNGEYRPGAITIEMPTMMAGHRSSRVERARDLSARASAVADKARNLIALEATDVFLKWQEARAKVGQTRDASEAGTRLATNTREAFIAGQKISIEDILTNQVIAGQARGGYNEALFDLNVALADLQRVTAGGFDAGLAAR